MNSQTSLFKHLNLRLTKFHSALDESGPIMAPNVLWGPLYVRVWNAHEQIDRVIGEDLDVFGNSTIGPEIEAIFAALGMDQPRVE